MQNLNILTCFMFAMLAFTLSSCMEGEAEEPVDCKLSAPELELQSKTDTQCNLSVGEVSVKAFGGSGDIQFQLNDGSFQNMGDFTSLSAGTYIITAKDENDCTSSLSVNINNADGLNISTSAKDAGCGTSKGSITVTGSNGQEPYTFKLGGAGFQSSNVFENLGPGDYQVTAKDATECETSATVSIKTGISFSSSVQAIITNNCAKSGCHNGSQAPDLRNFSSIQANATNIKRRTADKSMPKNGTLTQEEIDAITCWVDDGALNN